MKIKNNLKIVFFGTPEFALPVLNALYKNKLGPRLIITTPDKPRGRKMQLIPPPVKAWAQEQKIEFLQPKTLKDKDIINKLQNTASDFFIIASYGKILPKEILDIPKYGTLNIHPSLLPRWRGPSPIQYTILNGDKETGVTIMLTDEKMDHGPIVAQQELKNYKPGIINYEKLYDKLAKLGAQLLIETIPKWVSGEITPQEQNHNKATFSKIIKKENGHINWQNETAEEVEHKIRALNPWPSTYTFWGNKRLIILDAGIIPGNKNQKPGEVFEYESGFAIQTKKDALSVKHLKREGKNKTNTQDFLKGNSKIIGSILS